MDHPQRFITLSAKSQHCQQNRQALDLCPLVESLLILGRSKLHLPRNPPAVLPRDDAVVCMCVCVWLWLCSNGGVSGMQHHSTAAAMQQCVPLYLSAIHVPPLWDMYCSVFVMPAFVFCLHAGACVWVAVTLHTIMGGLQCADASVTYRGKQLNKGVYYPLPPPPHMQTRVWWRWSCKTKGHANNQHECLLLLPTEDSYVCLQWSASQPTHIFHAARHLHVPHTPTATERKTHQKEHRHSKTNMSI